VLNVTAALESIADRREELVQYVFDEFRYTPCNLMAVFDRTRQNANHESFRLKNQLGRSMIVQ
jgi:hypothetical protein